MDNSTSEKFLFQNETIYDQKTCIEATRLFFRLQKKYQIFRITYIAAALLLMVLLVWLSIQQRTASVFRLAVFVLLAALIVYMILRPFLFGKQMYKRNIYLNPQMRCTNTFTPDHLILQTAQSSIEIEYEKITHIGESRNFFVLLAKTSMVILDKNSFTMGKSSDFIAFIRTRCSTAKIRLDAN